MYFQYAADLLASFPKTVGGVIRARGMSNSPAPEALQAAFSAEQKQVIARIGEKALSDLPGLAAWRKTFSAFGVSPTQYRSAPEALLRRLTKQGDIPSINTLVDIGNLVSIRYGLPVAVMDSRDIADGITVRFADSSEHYTELDSDELKHPDKGEVIFADTNALVFARRWCWRQSFQSAARLNTVEALIVVEAQHENAFGDVEQATKDLVELFQTYAGGDYSWDVLSQNKPKFESYMMLKNYSEIRLITSKYADEGVSIGAIGTIIEVWEKPSLAYEVDFSDSQGITIALLTLQPEEIEQA